LPSLSLIDVHKSYGSTAVLDGVSLEMQPKEFIAFLGPSGSGKSTLLRIIAGLETLDSGEVWLNGARIDQLAPGDRGIALVFQQYALYPHMTVRENMAFGLRNAKWPQDEISQRIDTVAATLEIDQLLDRKPGQLSGGQRQRVAIGRAIVKVPKLFLLDEPLSNLDAALRNRTRVELAQLRQRVEAAIIMVTHDQAEAMTLADRIVVMNERKIQQVGTPMEIYDRPANSFVARFVGSPAMTMLPVTLIDGEGAFAIARLTDGTTVETRINRAELPGNDHLQLGLRPECVTIAPMSEASIEAEAILVERLGDRTLVYAKLSDGAEIIAVDRGDSAIKMGDAIGLRIDGHTAHLFASDGTGYHARQSA
jgi:multiple sugar transport system ATP-binding protein